MNKFDFMKNLTLMLLAAVFTLISCKKDPAKKAFLTGRLIDNCSGSPVANQKLNFYKNFKEGVNWLQADTDAEILETTTTDDNGVFYFSGEDYTQSSMTSYSNSSIRIGNQIIATGSLGKHYKAEANEFSHPDVGDILLNGMSTTVNFKIAESNGLGSDYDSVRVFSSYYNVYITLTDVTNGYFTHTISNQNLSIKNFWGDVNDGRYNLYLKLEFYYNSGNSIKEEWKDFYFDECATSGEALFEF